MFTLYGKQNYDIPPIQRAVVRYFLSCERDVPVDAKTDPPHVVDAKKRLEELRRRDPKLVADAERFHFFE